MSEPQDLQQQIQQQVMQSAQDFYGDSLGRIKGQIQNDRAQLEGLMEQSPPEAQDAAGQDLNITDAARQKADELGVDLSQVEGTGAEGRITVKDVTSAANQ